MPISNQLTIEIGLYALVVALALAVRLYRVGLAPLSVGEAQLALAAWRGVLPPAGASPLLTWLNAILFAFFESSDGVARLAPALAGSALVVLPALLRERIGRAGALGAAAILAISPVAIMTSRTASGEAIVGAVALGCVVAGDGYLRDGRAGWLYALAALLGVGLASGCTIYSALIALALAAGLVAALGRSELRDKWQAIRNTPGLPGRWLAVLAGVFLTCATALAWQMGGLRATIDLLSAWLAGFVAPAGMTGWQWTFQVLAVYEPLIFVAGIAGLFFAMQRGSRMGMLLIAWAIAAMALTVVRSGRGNGDELLIVIPLALLGGFAIEALAGSLRAVRLSVEEVILILLLLVLMAYALLGVADYLNNPTKFSALSPEQESSPGGRLRAILGGLTPVILVAAALVLAAFLMATFAAAGGAEMAVRGATIAILATLVMTTWAAGWGATQAHPGDPREIIAGAPATSLDVRDLMRDLAKLSADSTTDVSSLAVTVQSAPDDVLGWYLRHMPNARFVSTVDAASNPPAVISTDKPPALAGSYAGQRFTLQHVWYMEGKSATDVLKWLIYRRADPPQPAQEAVLWVQQGP